MKTTTLRHHLLATCLLVVTSASARPEEPEVIQIPASPALVELVGNWDPQIWFFTPQDNPLRTLNGLKRDEVACWGMEHFQRMQEFFHVLQIPGNGVKVMGDGAYNDSPTRPPLYVTWAKFSPDLRNVLRVRFMAAGQDTTPPVIPGPAGAQIRGVIMDHDTKLPVAGKTVRLFSPKVTTSGDEWQEVEDRKISVTTNPDGEFVFVKLPPGSFTLMVEYQRKALGGTTMPFMANVRREDGSPLVVRLTDRGSADIGRGWVRFE